MKKKQTVSLCMIVKNEEETILSCLNSVKYLVDDMIVVDTGSNDQTIALARAEGARVFQFSWAGDFARARNFSLKQAASDWILVLDADEVLEPVNVEEFNRLLDAHNVEGYFLHLKNYLGTGQEVSWDQVVRLFRNIPAYKFEKAIHEQVTASILKANNGKGLAEAPLTIHHYGYLNKQILKKDKSNRNITIINSGLKRNPGDPFLLYSMAMEYYRLGEISKGIVSLEKALGRMKGSEGYFEDVVINVAFGLLTTGKPARLVSFTSKSLEMMPGHPDLMLLRGLGCIGLSRYREAVVDLERTLQKGGSKVFPEFRILSILGDARNLAGNHSGAEKAYLSALHRCNKFLYPLTRILGLFRRGSHINLGQISRFAPTRDKIILWKELLKAGENQLAIVVMLLSIYDLARGGKQNEGSLQLIKESSESLARIASLSGRKESLRYIEAAAREIHAYALVIAKEYDCCHFPARERLKFLIEKILLLLVTEFCPPWTPGPYSYGAVEEPGNY